MDFRQCDQFRERSVSRNVSARPGEQGGHGRDKQRREEFPAVAIDARLLDIWVEAEQPFNLLRRDVFAVGGHQDVFFAVGDVQESLVIQVADIPGMEPALGVNGFRGGPRFVPVTLHNVRAA